MKSILISAVVTALVSVLATNAINATLTAFWRDACQSTAECHVGPR